MSWLSGFCGFRPAFAPARNTKTFFSIFVSYSAKYEKNNFVMKLFWFVFRSIRKTSFRIGWIRKHVCEIYELNTKNNTKKKEPIRKTIRKQNFFLFVYFFVLVFIVYTKKYVFRISSLFFVFRQFVSYRVRKYFSYCFRMVSRRIPMIRWSW